jgi:hypothetical protein
MTFMAGTLSPIGLESKALLSHHRQGRDRIRPPPPQDGMEREAGQENGREPHRPRARGRESRSFSARHSEPESGGSATLHPLVRRRVVVHHVVHVAAVHLGVHCVGALE